MKRVYFNVIQSDIDGAGKKCTDCPVHKSLKRAFPQARQVEPMFVFAMIDDKVWRLDKNAQRWIHNYIHDKTVPKPFAGFVEIE